MAATPPKNWLLRIPDPSAPVENNPVLNREDMQKDLAAKLHLSDETTSEQPVPPAPAPAVASPPTPAIPTLMEELNKIPWPTPRPLPHNHHLSPAKTKKWIAAEEERCMKTIKRDLRRIITSKAARGVVPAELRTQLGKAASTEQQVDAFYKLILDQKQKAAKRAYERERNAEADALAEQSLNSRSEEKRLPRLDDTDLDLDVEPPLPTLPSATPRTEEAAT